MYARYVNIISSILLLPRSSFCSSSTAAYSWSGSLVVEAQRSELFDQLVQSVLLLVDDVQVVGQRSEQTLTPWHDHVSVKIMIFFSKLYPKSL